MFKIEVEVTNETGLHARPATLFVKEASKYASNITIVKDEKNYNAKSIISILSMGAGKGTKLEIMTDGEDEKDAAFALKELIESNFGE